MPQYLITIPRPKIIIQQIIAPDEHLFLAFSLQKLIAYLQIYHTSQEHTYIILIPLNPTFL